MADVIWITEPLVQVFGSAVVQSLDSVIDVSAYDELYIQSYCLAVELPLASPTLTVSLYTGMQNYTTDGWLQVFSNTFATTGTDTGSCIFANLVTKGNFLRYIRWQASAVAQATSMTFFMAGVARAYPAELPHG